MFQPDEPFTTTETPPFPGGFAGILPFHPLSAGLVHEIRAPAGTAGHIAFAAILLAETSPATPILWVSAQPSVYPPGLAWLGLDPARCLFAQARDDTQSLATLEVALRGGMAGVAECGAVSRLAARRLALAAKTGGSTGFLLRHVPASTPNDSTAFATRWLITPSPGQKPGAPRLRAELLYAKAGQPGVFMLEIKEAAHGAAPAIVTLVQPGLTGQPRLRAG